MTEYSEENGVIWYDKRNFYRTFRTGAGTARTQPLSTASPPAATSTR